LGEKRVLRLVATSKCYIKHSENMMRSPRNFI